MQIQSPFSVTRIGPTPVDRPYSGPRRRVLIAAFGVSPIRGSEAAVGWHIPKQIARYHDVTVLMSPGVDGHNRREVEDYLRDHGDIPGLSFHYVTPPPLSAFFDADSSSIKRMFFYVGYASWQREAYRQMRDLHKQQPFDVIHQLNIIGYREPSYLWKLDAPFVWGPVGGASNLPWSYFSLLSKKDKLVYGLRNVANEIQKRTKLRAKRAGKAAKHIWVVSRDNQQMVEKHFGRESEYMPEVGTSIRDDASVKDFDGSTPLRLLWSGYHIGRKAVPLLLHAMTRFRTAPVELTMLGTGPERGKWEALATELGIQDRVRWTGELPHAKALAEMSRAHVFVFPSLQEASSTVTLEALSLGMPVICHEVCGMGLVVTDDCGIRVPTGTPQSSIEGFATAIQKLLNNPAELTRLSIGAMQRGHELTWENKARQISETYERVIQVTKAAR